MNLRARARLVTTAVLALGVAGVLALANLVSRQFIETSGPRSRAPLLRPAAVFSPVLAAHPTAGGASDVDAVSGGRTPTPRTIVGHAPQSVPDELLLSLAPAPRPDAGAGDAKPVPTAPPRLELIEEELWRP